MVKDVGDSEIVPEGGDDEGNGSQHDGSEDNNAGATSSLA